MKTLNPLIITNLPSRGFVFTFFRVLFSTICAAGDPMLSLLKEVVEELGDDFDIAMVPINLDKNAGGELYQFLKSIGASVNNIDQEIDESAEEYKREIFFKTIVAETVTVDFSKLDVGYPPHCECSQFCDMRQPNAEYLEQHDVVDLAPCIWVCVGQKCMFWKPVMGEKFWENALGLDGEAVAKEKDPVLRSEAVDKSEERVAAFWDDICEVIATPDEVAINLIVGHAIHPLCSCG